MFIKTVSTISGINPIKFDETGGVFYWILNTGSSTIYASTKSAFTAGDDGVVSLGPKESRRLETNNDTIYILGEGVLDGNDEKDAELEEKIISLYPNFDFVLGDDGNIADVTATEPVPAEEVPEPPTNAELAAAIAELAEVTMRYQA